MKYIFIAFLIIVLSIAFPIDVNAFQDINEIGQISDDNSMSLHETLKQKYIEGNWKFMSLVFGCLILGIAIILSKILTLNQYTSTTKRVLASLEKNLKSNSIDQVKDGLRQDKSKLAFLFLEGLGWYDRGLNKVEERLISSGSVLVGEMQKGLSWVSLFIAIAPMLGFMGTVFGMISAFDSIASLSATQGMSPSVVAGGIKVALITTVAGLAVAIILLLFYNYLTNKIDLIQNEMEDASSTFMDLLVHYRNLC